LWVGTASSRGREAVVEATMPPTRDRRSAVQRIAAARAPLVAEPNIGLMADTVHTPAGANRFLTLRGGPTTEIGC
jgi:hypothetical protein